MVNIGKVNRLKIAKERSVGYFFDGGEAGDILMPKRHQPEHCEVDEWLDVFVFHDAEGRLTATVHWPVAQVGEVAWLKVVGMHRAGAFLDWGLTKDLLVPHREQAEEMVLAEHYLVYIYLDPFERILGSSKLEHHIKETVAPNDYKPSQQVELVVAESTELGLKVIVNHRHWGMLYHNEIFQPLRVGQKLKGFIKKVREDQRLDISLQPQGYNNQSMEQLASRIMKQIEASGGLLTLTDKSPPEVIYAAFQVSKKNFKQAVGKLYKDRRITIEPEGLKAVPKARKPKKTSS